MIDFNLITLPLILAILYTVGYIIIKRDFLLIIANIFLATTIILVALRHLIPQCG